MIGYDAVLTSDFDLQLDADGDILTADAFNTALLMSLFCERRAQASEVPAPENRRGWIGNESDPDGFEIGSKLWLHEQSRITKTSLQDIVTSGSNGLQWLVNDNIITSFNVYASLSNDNILITVEIYRPNSEVEYKYFNFWSNTGAA